MKAALSSLKSFLSLSLPAEDVAEAFTMAGIEVDNLEKVDGDFLFEISLTPNLGHCLSVFGLARELSAILSLPLKRPQVTVQEKEKLKTADGIQVEINDREGCQEYSCRIVSHVKVGPSPDWLKHYLEHSGIRSLNNVVDIGNYVMLEYGQPLHLFDYEAIEGKSIIVRTSKKGETLVTLDEIPRAIPEETLLICDSKKPLAFAGIMGGASSAISDKTHTVLIESARFAPHRIRKASKSLGLRSESSHRFERGIDPEMTKLSLDRAAELLGEIAHGKVHQGRKEVVTFTPAALVIDCHPLRVNKLLGTSLSHREMAQLLERLEMSIVHEEESVLRVKVPPYRHDVKAEIDLIEEIGRLYGFNNIELHPPRAISSQINHNPLYILEETVRQKLVAQGLQECMTCDLISPNLANLTAEKALGREAQIHVLHPSSIDQSVLRLSLLPGLLQVVRSNFDHQNEHLSFFEVGHIHFKEDTHFRQQSAAAILLTGLRDPSHFNPQPSSCDFFDIKGRMEDLLTSLGLFEVDFETSHLHNFHPGRQARIKIGNLSVGVIGEVHPSHLHELGIEKRVYYGELNLYDLHPLIEAKKAAFQFQPLPIYPGSIRDWTLTLPEIFPVGQLMALAKAISSPIREKVEVLDLYKSEKIGKDRKNVSLRFRYRDREKTLSFQEVDEEHKRLTQKIFNQINEVKA